jgi:MYXO-CTERM domain-containing protein
LGGNVVQNANTTNTVTISAALDLNGATRTFTLNNTSANFTISGAIGNSTGTAGLTKAGAGTLILSAANTFTGTTTVSAGTLLVNNATDSGTGSGEVNVNSGATLGGTGAISGAVNVSGVLSPGSSIESLGTGTLTFNDESSFNYEINTDTVGGDLLHVSGGLNIGSNVTLNLTDLASLSETLTVDTKFTLLSYTGAWNSGTFNGYADDSTFLFASNQWRINYNDLNGGSNFTSDQAGATGFVTLTVIPEPSSAMLGLGGLGALLLRRRRRN